MRRAVSHATRRELVCVLSRAVPHLKRKWLLAAKAREKLAPEEDEDDESGAREEREALERVGDAWRELTCLRHEEDDEGSEADDDSREADGARLVEL